MKAWTSPRIGPRTGSTQETTIWFFVHTGAYCCTHIKLLMFWDDFWLTVLDVFALRYGDRPLIAYFLNYFHVLAWIAYFGLHFEISRQIGINIRCCNQFGINLAAICPPVPRAGEPKKSKKVTYTLRHKTYYLFCNNWLIVLNLAHVILNKFVINWYHHFLLHLNDDSTFWKVKFLFPWQAILIFDDLQKLCKLIWRSNLLDLNPIAWPHLSDRDTRWVSDIFKYQML